MPTFKNRPNKVHKINGKEVWESRSTAILPVILAIYKDNIFVLIGKRSKIMDSPGLWCLPSGYIDYDENGFDALRRAVYEETSLDIQKYKKYLVYATPTHEPFYVQTKPTENRQNITLSYCFIYDFSGRDLPREIESYTDKESDEVKWIPIEDVFTSKYKWAFNHDERIEMAVLKFKKYLL